jgi:hypothetical protein
MIVMPMRRNAAIPLGLAVVLLGLLYGLALPLGWSRGAIGVGLLVILVVVGIIRAEMTDYREERRIWDERVARWHERKRST